MPQSNAMQDLPSFGKLLKKPPSPREVAPPAASEGVAPVQKPPETVCFRGFLLQMFSWSGGLDDPALHEHGHEVDLVHVGNLGVQAVELIVLHCI